MARSNRQPASGDSPPGQGDTTRKHIRGSSLLLAGRCAALAINLAVQVITVRYLAKEDFGAFAFGISMVALGTNLSLLGLTKSLNRFVPIYHEQGDQPRLAGALVLMFATALGLGLATVALVFGLQNVIAERVASNSLSLSLLLMLIALVPIDALDGLLQSLFGAFGKVRAILVRRHLVGPGLKLLAVVGVVVFGGDVRMLAICYVAAGIAGIALYASLLYRLLTQEKLLPYFRPGNWQVPAREIFGYTVPVFSSQIGFVVRTSLIVLLLEAMRGSEQVAELRAVFPFARLNEVVLTSFAFLFTPMASRLFARNDKRGIDQLYWRTSVWILMLSLPAFLVTGVLAKPLTIFVFGQQYAAAGPVLMILAVGVFIDAVMGFNLHTLRVFAKLRQIVAIDVVSISTALGLCFLLVPTYGAFGAAVAICSATILQNVLLQIAMRLTTGVGSLNWHYVRFYAVSGLGIAALGAAQWAWEPPLLVGLSLAALIYVVLLFCNRALMEVEDTFPELARIPIVGRLLVVPPKAELTSAAEGRP